MTLSQTQYNQLLTNFINTVIEGMDLDDLITFAAEQLELNLKANCSLDDELVDEITRIYDSEEAAVMLQEVGANPSDFNL